MSGSEQLLALDTSTENAGIAVTIGEHAVELRWTSGREQTVSVLDQIDRCLSLAGTSASDLTGIAIATGPGMFNGLRVGISLAKGFALSLGVPIVGVSTLDVTASPWLGFGRDVLAVVAAGRGRIVWSRYGEELESGTPPENTLIDELVERVRAFPGVVVAGEIPADRTAELEQQGAVVRTGAAAARSPIVLSQLALKKLRAGERDDLVTLEPMYVHGRSVAKQKLTDGKLP